MPVRLAVAKDVAVVTAITDAAYQHYVPILGRKPRPMLDDHAARIARGETFLVEDGAEPVGLIALVPEPEALHIFSIAIRPEAQGHDLLNVLLGHAEAMARRHSLPKLTLITNALMTRNRAIYAHLGFAEMGIEAGDGYEIVFMERPIRDAPLASA
jgi:ribosomal protein S18 acetylase RimI-like enzyme